MTNDEAPRHMPKTSGSDLDGWDQDLSTLAQALDAALAAPEGSEERRHCAEHLDRMASQLSKEQNAWMLEDDQPDLVERDGSMWLRLRKWEGERGIRAWMLVPPWYEPHEE